MPGKAKSYTLGSKAAKNSGLHELTLPSGETCQARRPGAQGLIEAGLLDNFDELTALVQTQHIEPNSPKGIAAREKVTKEDEDAAAVALMADPEKLGTAFSLIDRLTVYVVTAPLLWVDYKLKVKDPAAKDGERVETDEEFSKREEDATKNKLVAVRLVDLDDKMWLLGWAMGGQPDLKGFREGSESPVVHVAASETVQLPAE